MSQLLFWPTVTFFYPVGNTSAVCLTENLSPESKADVLLLACGDPRHILYTVYANETNPLTSLRPFDITCCDVDVAVLARNALLFTFLADDNALNGLDNLWNLFYHMFIDKASLSMLLKQCRKLVALAESSETWRAGPYGHFLTTCDTATLSELRRVWTAYLDTDAFSSKRAKCFEQQFTEGMKEMSKNVGPGGTTTAGRSAGPLLLHAMQAVSRQFSNYWSSGTTDDGAQERRQGEKRRLNVNPTFAFSIDGDKFSVHYGTDPLSGFHLAEAFASLKFSRPDDSIPPHKVVRIAKDQFSRWCTSMHKRLTNNNPSSPTFVIRMFGGDVLMFCQALKYCEMTRSPRTPYNVAAWRLSTITLDGRYYGVGAMSPAPLSFNVIDTSNILDHVGLVNVLVVTAPLLCKTPTATLYTEALLRMGDDPSQALLEHVCGDLPTMALLLGVIPSTLISRFTTRSNVHETLMMSGGAKQYHERLAWKAVGLGVRARCSEGNVPTLSQRLHFTPQGLATFLFRVYVHMFSDEDVESRLRLLFLSPERMLQALQRSGILHYNRRSFALFVHFVKTRVQTDWWGAMDLFEDLVMAEDRLMTGQHAYQELCCQLHLLGVYTPQWLSVPTLHRLRLDYEGDMGIFGGHLDLFRDWTRARIPQVIVLVLVVPRDAIARLEADLGDVGTPCLHCDMEDGPRQAWFAVTSATFGSLQVSGEGEHRTGLVIQGGEVNPGAGTMQPLWRTGEPLVITFSVPSVFVMDFARNPRATIGLALRPTIGVTAKFADKLGFSLSVFKTLMRDTDRVFLMARPPIVGRSTERSTNSDVIVPVANHWRENMLSSEQAASSSDIHVQMSDVSSAVESFTVRIDVTDPGAQATLADTRTIPTFSSSSGSVRSLDADLRIGTYTTSVQFPLPVDVVRAKLRVARRSFYIEVVAPLAPFEVRPERDFSNRFATLSSAFDDDGTPTLGSIHRINLDRCPTFKVSKGPSKISWYDIHTSFMFSALEKERAFRARSDLSATHNGSTPTSDTLLKVKQTLNVLFRSAAGTKPDKTAPENVFALCDASRHEVPYLYIVVGRACLDVGSHTVVADAFVAVATPAVRAAMETVCVDQAPQKPRGIAIGYVTTDADETAAWFHLLPRLTERCRAWPHKTTCTYRTSKNHTEPKPETWTSQSPLCTCGTGIGSEILPKPLERVAPYLTRAAFSPLFPVPYLREVDVHAWGPVLGTGKPRKNVTCCRTLKLHDGSADLGKTNAVEFKCQTCGEDSGLTCSRCKRARYCSKACQRADWKAHKEACGTRGP